VLSARSRGVITSRYRRALTRTAVNAVAAGLPVVPGAWWSAAEQRFECDLGECGRTGPHPAVRNDTAAGLPGRGVGLSAHAVRHPDAVVARWNRKPYTVLVPTGETCDVVDVPAAVGRNLAVRLDSSSALGPVIAAGSRWFFLTAPGGQLPALGGDVLVHGQGSWIMLPPSLGPGGAPATWLVRPDRYGWSLPGRDEVMRSLAPMSVPAPRPTPVPRSTDRSDVTVRQASPTPA
jgi:bifunctional DNA primase/polymerase-like protein